MWVLFIGSLVGALAQAMGSFAGRAALSLGVGTVTYTGISFAVNAIRDNVMSSVRGLPADALGLVGYLWMDKMLTIIFSAIVASLTMRLVSGSIKKVIVK